MTATMMRINGELNDCAKFDCRNTGVIIHVWVNILQEAFQTMKLTEFFREQLDREVERSRKALEQVPEGKYDWKPHEKSMLFGYLADMVATIPTWITMEINRDELDVAPAEGQGPKKAPKETSADLVKALDEAAAEARTALESTTDEHLGTNWKLLARGQVVWQG